MPEDPLQAEDVAAVEKVVLGEGVAAAMGRYPNPSDAFPAGLSPQHLLHAVPGQRKSPFA